MQTFSTVYSSTFICSLALQCSSTWWRSCWNIQCLATLAPRDGWRVASYFFGRGCPTQPSLWCTTHPSTEWALLTIRLCCRGSLHWIADTNRKHHLKVFLASDLFDCWIRWRQLWSDRSTFHTCTARCHWCKKRSEWDQEFRSFFHSCMSFELQEFSFDASNDARVLCVFLQGFVVFISLNSLGFVCVG